MRKKRKGKKVKRSFIEVRWESTETGKQKSTDKSGERGRISRQNWQNSGEGRGPGNSDGDEHGDIRDLPPRE